MKFKSNVKQTGLRGIGPWIFEDKSPTITEINSSQQTMVRAWKNNTKKIHPSTLTFFPFRKKRYVVQRFTHSSDMHLECDAVNFHVATI